MNAPLKADKQALSLVPQIKQAHKELVEIETKGFTTALAKAIDLGVLLNLAKEAVYHGHWETWFEQQGFAFSYRSANRYMRLAKKREDLEAAMADTPHVAKMAGEGELSIRAAEAIITPQSDDPEAVNEDENDEEEDRPADEDGSRRRGGSGDPDEAIAEAAPDEIVTVIKRDWDEEKRIDLLLALLHDLKPSEIVTAVIEALNDDTAAKYVGEGIMRQLQSPAQSRPRLRIPRVVPEKRAEA